MKPWDNIELTDEEREQALIEAKKRRYFHEKNKPYWDRQNARIEAQKKTKRAAGFKME